MSLVGIFLVSVFVCSPLQAQEEDLSVVEDWMAFTDAENALYHHLTGQAYDLLDERKRKVRTFRTEAQWRARQQDIRKTLGEILGPFPDRTPLNAEVVETIQKDGYRVEHVIYESMPGFEVTSSLFIPDDVEGQAPGIVYCSGHTENGYRSETYQHVILNLVRKGFVVFAFDPVSQGERRQYYDPDEGESRIGGSTNEHSYSAVQAFISGRSQARYMTWDGIRAIDYLVDRPEVDPERIGVTGRSGGGTQSAYISAVDERVQAAAPENYLTNFRRLLQSIAPQDGEQNFYHGIVSEIDHADLVEVRAPKPTLMITTTRDIFNIEGARSTYREASRAYQAFDAGDHLQMVEDDGPHTSTEANREAMYAFFQEHLENPGDSRDEDVQVHSQDELQVTETGQVSTAGNPETVFSLNKQETQAQIDRLEQAREELETHLPAARRSARRLSGYRQPIDVGDPVLTGRYQREGYVIEQYFVEGEGDYPIPYLLFRPDDGGSHPAAVYLHPEGKATHADAGGPIESLVDQGYIVLAPDLLDIGEMGPGDLTGDAYIGNVSYNKWFAAVQIGRSITGVRAGDVNRLTQILLGRSDVTADGITAVAYAEMAPVLLHAASFEPGISEIALMDPLVSYRALVMNKYYMPEYTHAAVAGALQAYDLPDLAATLAPRELLMVNVTDGEGNPAGAEVMEEDLSVVHRAYEAAGADSHLRVTAGETDMTKSRELREWLSR
jgi:dienelactone hydrolase